MVAHLVPRCGERRDDLGSFAYRDAEEEKGRQAVVSLKRRRYLPGPARGPSIKGQGDLGTLPVAAMHDGRPVRCRNLFMLGRANDMEARWGRRALSQSCTRIDR